MIPARFRILLWTMVSNALSYLFEITSIINIGLKMRMLRILLIISEHTYIFSYSHCTAYRLKIDDNMRNTHYVRDGYGRRYRVSRRSNPFFHPDNFRPRLPPHPRGGLHRTPHHIPIVRARPRGGVPPQALGPGGADVVDGTYADGRAKRAEGRPAGMSPGPGAPSEGTRANTGNIRVAECSEATGMERIRPVASVSERRAYADLI